MKKLKLPTPHTILILITGLVAILTWLIPAGKFDTLKFDKASNSFVYSNATESKSLPVEQKLSLIHI